MPGWYPARSIAASEQLQRFLVRRQVGREAALVAEAGRQAAVVEQPRSAWYVSAPQRSASEKLDRADRERA